MTVLDTNVWVYFYDKRDPRKQAIAQALVQNVAPPVGLPWQVGCEFVWACRKLLPTGFSEQDTWDALTKIRASVQVVLLPREDLWDDTRALMPRFGISFWDALLASACLRGGTHTLYSEDFGTLGAIDSMKIINPFAVP